MSLPPLIDLLLMDKHKKITSASALVTMTTLALADSFPADRTDAYSKKHNNQMYLVVVIS